MAAEAVEWTVRVYLIPGYATARGEEQPEPVCFVMQSASNPVVTKDNGALTVLSAHDDPRGIFPAGTWRYVLSEAKAS